jgi:hypothetical protein
MITTHRTYLYCISYHIIWTCGVAEHFTNIISAKFVLNLHSIYDRLKSASTPQNRIAWRHNLKSWSDLRIFSNRHPFQILRSKTDYWLGLGLGHMSVTSLDLDVDMRKWEMAIDFKIWELKKDIDLIIGCQFENLTNRHRSEVQMSVT